MDIGRIARLTATVAGADGRAVQGASVDFMTSRRDSHTVYRWTEQPDGTVADGFRSVLWTDSLRARDALQEAVERSGITQAPAGAVGDARSGSGLVTLTAETTHDVPGSMFALHDRTPHAVTGSATDPAIAPLLDRLQRFLDEVDQPRLTAR